MGDALLAGGGCRARGWLEGCVGWWPVPGVPFPGWPPPPCPVKAILSALVTGGAGVSHCRRQPWLGEHPWLRCAQHHLGDLGLCSAPRLAVPHPRLSLLPPHPPCVPQFPRRHTGCWSWSPLGTLGELQGTSWEQGARLSPRGAPRDRFTPAGAACPIPSGGGSQGCEHPRWQGWRAGTALDHLLLRWDG